MQLLGNVHLIQGSGFDGNIYVLRDRNSVTLIDTGTGLSVSDIYRYVESLGLRKEAIRKVVLTHVHIDHSGGLPRIVKDLSPQVLVYELEAPYIETGRGSVILSTLMGMTYPPTKVDVKLKDGETLEIGENRLKVINTPGHTAGSICLFDEEKGMLFSGDTVFADGSFGRVDFPTGDPDALVKSIEMLSGLEVKHLFPGHMNPVINEGRKHIELAAKSSRMFL
ncbi:MAG: MBL fold metallo-hydrolase [Promethearchaeati archaeon SRVP18_Atabeyarchaeia-1]